MGRPFSAGAAPGSDRQNVQHRDDLYAIRMLLCTAAALVILLLFVRTWPFEQASSLEPEPDPQIFALAIDEIRPVVHSRASPPPPPPVPIEVADDFRDDIPELDFNVELPSSGSGETIGLTDTGDDEAAGGNNVYVPPRPLRFVEPENTREAQRRGVRARIVVRVSVDASGIVTSAQIIDRFMAEGEAGAELQPVGQVDFGLEEAALSAAKRWLFRPARSDGLAVAAHYELTFRFGV